MTKRDAKQDTPDTFESAYFIVDGKKVDANGKEIAEKKDDKKDPATQPPAGQ